MTFTDDLDRPLRQLQTLVPDASRAAKVRARCHARLARVTSKSEPTPAESSVVRNVLAPAAVGCLCALYLVSLVTNLLRLTRGL